MLASAVCLLELGEVGVSVKGKLWWSQPALKSRPMTLSSRIHHEVRTGSSSWLACLTHGQPRVVARRRTRSPLLPCAADLVCCELTFAAYRVCCEPPWKEKLTVLGRYAGLEPGKRYSGGTSRGWQSLGGPSEDHRCGEEGPSPKKKAPVNQHRASGFVLDGCRNADPASTWCTVGNTCVCWRKGQR